MTGQQVCVCVFQVVAVMAPPHRTPLLVCPASFRWIALNLVQFLLVSIQVVACAALLAAYALSEAFAVTTSPKAGSRSQ